MSKSEIRLHFEPMSSDDLLKIWNENDREQYADQTFKIISEILKERVIDIPMQNSTSKSEEPKKLNIPYLNKILGFRSGTKWKMIVAGLFYLFLISKILSGFGTNGSGVVTAPTTPATTAPITTAPPDTDNLKKQQAENAITAFDGIIKSFNSLATSYQGELQDIGTGTIDPVTGYSDLSKLNTQALSLYRGALALNVPSQYNDSKEPLQMAISYLQNSISESKNYMDNQKISSLASAKDDLQQALNAAQTVNLAVAAQAVKDGYTPPASK